MAILWTRTRRAGALVSLAVAASTTVGAAASQAGVAAAAERSPASGVSWHPLTLVNGGGSLSASGRAEYAIKAGVVYLGGGIFGGSTSLDFARLPAAARPGHTLWLDASTVNGTVGYLAIYPSGVMYAEDGTGSASAFTSLAGVSFPGRTIRSHGLGLLHGWKSSQPQWNSGNPAYNVSNGIVYLSGSLHGGTSAKFAMLPKGARPSHEVFVSVYTYQGTQGQLGIDPDGTMFAAGPSARSFTSLAGVSFPVAAVRTHRLTLLNGWARANAATGTPSYTVRNGVVYLEGALSQYPAGPISCARLPVGLRPVHTVYVQTRDGYSTTGAVRIQPSGIMSCYNTVQSDAAVETVVWGVSYPVNS